MLTQSTPFQRGAPHHPILFFSLWKTLKLPKTKNFFFTKTREQKRRAPHTQITYNLSSLQTHNVRCNETLRLLLLIPTTTYSLSLAQYFSHSPPTERESFLYPRVITQKKQLLRCTDVTIPHYREGDQPPTRRLTPLSSVATHYTIVSPHQ